MRAFIYLRQSLDRAGTNAAVDRQREDCLKLISERGWTHTETFVDNDVSASGRKPRPAYTQMLEAIEAGRADILVAWHVDRLTRKLTDLEDLIELSQRTGLRIATVTGDLDLSTDAGRLVGRILASVARGEVERKGARQRRALEQAAAQGRPAGGRRAFGYTSNGLDVVPEEAPLVAEAYADLLAGASLKSIARRWNDRGVTTTMGGTWRHDNVRTLLKNPRYAGLRTHRGEIVGPGVWPALIDEDTHAAAVALLSMPSRRTTASTARKYLLPGLARCGRCGSDMATGHSRHGKRLYVCRAGKCISRRADDIDELVEQIILRRLAQPDAAELLGDSDAGRIEALRHQSATLHQRRDDLAEGLADGVLTLPAVRKSSMRIEAELERIHEEISQLMRTDALGAIVSADDVAKVWSGFDLQQRRSVIDSLITVTVNSPPPGLKTFHPESIQIDWRSAAARR